jgi:hypothetical protein
MVKRILTILFFLVHTVTQAGTVLNVHYCMGDLASISIGAQEDESCAFCGMRDESCCHDEQQVIKQVDTSCLVNSITKVDFYLPDRKFFSFGLSTDLFEELHFPDMI